MTSGLRRYISHDVLLEVGWFRVGAKYCEVLEKKPEAPSATVVSPPIVKTTSLSFLLQQIDHTRWPLLPR
jgi:hypothetical protein